MRPLFYTQQYIHVINLHVDIERERCVCCSQDRWKLTTALQWPKIYDGPQVESSLFIGVFRNITYTNLNSSASTAIVHQQAVVITIQRELERRTNWTSIVRDRPLPGEYFAILAMILSLA